MLYRHSELWPRQEGLGRVGVKWIALTNEEVDTHMKSWADAGYELVSATTMNVSNGHALYFVHSFYWRKAE
jgi:imidazoleglycerol phosphate synthase glutamine amidotransferase subunit HisH